MTRSLRFAWITSVALVSCVCAAMGCGSDASSIAPGIVPTNDATGAPEGGDSIAPGDGTPDGTSDAPGGCLVTGRDGWTNESLTPTASDVGPALLIDPKGFAHAVLPGGIRYLTNASGAWTTEVTTTDTGFYTSLDRDAAGKIHIAYVAIFGAEGPGVYYTTNASGAWKSQRIAAISRPDSPLFTSLKVDPSGHPHVVFSSIGGGDPALLLHATNAKGSWAVDTIVSSTSQFPNWPSLAIDKSGGLHVTYTVRMLAYAKNTGSGWVVEGVPGAPLNVGGTSLALDDSGGVHVAFSSHVDPNFPPGTLGYAEKVAGAWTVSTVDPDASWDTSINGGWGDRQPSIAVRGDDVHIAYHHFRGHELRYAARLGSVWRTQSVDSRGSAGYWPSVALDAKGLAHVLSLELCFGSLRHSVGKPPDGKDTDCDGVVDQHVVPRPACPTPATSPPVTLSGSCDPGSGYPLSSYVADTRTSPELHMVNVYESKSPSVDVHFDRSAPGILFLSAYSRAKWNVSATNEGCLTRVIVSGHDSQCVIAPEGVPVEIHQGTDYLGCGYRWPDTGGGCSTPTLVTAAETASKAKVSSFAGCYHSDGFTVGG